MFDYQIFFTIFTYPSLIRDVYKKEVMRKKLTTKEFIERSKIVHGDKYDYSKVEYVNNHTKVCIICPEHGEFWQAPSMHLRGQGCPKCANNEKMTTEEFIEKAVIIHGKKYFYGLINYLGNKNKVKIICPEHGIFLQRPNEHLSGCGCPKCGRRLANEKITKNTEYFINKANILHNYRYFYNKSFYKNAKSKICITCPIHGDFWQTPNDHLNGCGCPYCNNSKLENDIQKFLNENKIKYINHCNKKHFKWLNKQHLDFYLPDYNIAIECQGRQHFEPVDFAGKGIEWAKNELNDTIIRDKIKKELCKKESIKLFYYDGNNFKNAFTNEINNIKNILV